MKKNLVRLLTVFVCIVALWPSLAVQAQSPITDNVANTSPNALPNEPVTLVCDVKVQLPDDFAQVVGEGTLKISKAVTQSG